MMKPPADGGGVGIAAEPILARFHRRLSLHKPIDDHHYPPYIIPSMNRPMIPYSD